MMFDDVNPFPCPQTPGERVYLREKAFHIIIFDCLDTVNNALDIDQKTPLPILQENVHIGIDNRSTSLVYIVFRLNGIVIHLTRVHECSTDRGTANCTIDEDLVLPIYIP